MKYQTKTLTRKLREAETDEQALKRIAEAMMDIDPQLHSETRDKVEIVNDRKLEVEKARRESGLGRLGSHTKRI